MIKINSYVPQYIRQLFGKYKNVGQIPLPYIHTGQMGVLFTDVCGFTKLTEKLSEKGYYGIESVTEVLNRYFEKMVNVIRDSGGSLMKYGGDSILAIFPGNKDVAMHSMMECRKLMMKELDTLNIIFKSRFDVEINFHGGISWGEITLCITGNPEYHLDYFLYGDAMKEAFELGEAANPGEINISSTFSYEGSNIAIQPGKISKADNSIISLFLPSRIREKLLKAKFKAELRNSAVIFLNLKSATDEEIIDPKDYHAFYCNVQKIVYTLDGTINKIDYNDKGYMILITFGVPYIHQDDIERACICSYKITKLEHNNVLCKIGINYSNIFAGDLGAGIRKEYGIIGNAVNIAARLMSESQYGETAFSSEILNKINSRFEAKYFKTTKVKGVRDEIAIYKLIRELPEYYSSYQSKYENIELFCPHNELQHLRQILSGRQGKIALIMGRRGTGKSILAFKAAQSLSQDQAKTELLVLEEYNKLRELSLVTQILKKKLEISDISKDIKKISQFAKSIPVTFDYSLLESFFDNAKAITNIDEVKKLIIEFLADIVAAILSESNTLIIDNYHWIDSFSAKVMAKAIPRLRVESNLKIVITALDKETVKQLIPYSDGSIILKNLVPEDCEKFIETQLSNITRDAKNLLYEITSGNILFLSEMLRIISTNFDTSAGLLTDSHINDMISAGTIPDSIDNLFIQEFDSLEESEQYVLKIASIVGEAFSIEELKIVETDESKEVVFRILSELEKVLIINEKTIRPDVEYVFSSSVMREAIYKTILSSEKKALHNRIAYFYEEKHQEDLYSYYELIAYHFIRAENRSKTFEYCLLSGKKHFDTGSYSSALSYYERAYNLQDDETLKQPLLLKLSELRIILGNFKDAHELLDKYDFRNADKDDSDKYIILIARLLSLESKAQETLDFIDKYADKLTSTDGRYNLEIYRLNALRALSRYDEYETTANRLFAELESHGRQSLLSRLAMNLGEYYLNRAIYDKAQEYYLLTVKYSDETRDIISKRIALKSMGIINARLGNKEKALEYYTQSMEICEKIGDKNGYSKVLMDIGAIYQNDGEFDKTLEMYNKSLSLARAAGNLMQIETILYNSGMVHYYKEEFGKAMLLFFRSLKIAEKISDKVGISYAYDAIGDTYFTFGQLNNTIKKVHRAQEIYIRNYELQTLLKDNEGLAHTYGNLGNVAKELREYDKAAEYYAKQQRMLSEIGDQNGEGRAFFNWGFLDIEQNKKEEGIKKLEKALELFEKCSAGNFAEFTRNELQKLKG